MVDVNCSWSRENLCIWCMRVGISESFTLPYSELKARMKNGEIVKMNVMYCCCCNASKETNFVTVFLVMQHVLILSGHDKCVAKHKLNVRLNAHKTFSVNSRIPKSSETTFVAPKTRFSEKATQSKNLDTTSVASKSKIDEASASKARDKVVQIVLWVVDSGCSKNMTGDCSLLRNFVENFMGTQNGVVERRNRSLVEAARTMLIFSRLPEFLWAEAVATACFTQNRLIINTRYNKTPYELLRERNPNVEYFHVFGSLCYPTNDCDDLGKMKPKADIGVFIGYSETSRGFRSHTSDLDNLFRSMFEDYFAQKSSNFSINSAAQPTHDQEDTPSTSSIIIDTHEAPPVVTTSDEQTSPISLQESNEFNQKDSADFDGGLQFLGEKLVSWSSKKQDCTAMSTDEAEYVSLSACCTQVIWMRTQLLDYGYKYNRIPMYCDSKSAIAISCNLV
ncbi:retrovirus-related pol polyprotein from transposon TNT 1-94 [Tanacetum coccineum]|uniref:Retrovirus-related pol polyprotein from transposon TNT 1-94 n=1 Tax=Tanacetum coccineum TaxID=301880 RepID=A0ABQ5GLE1_9ASTR